MSEETGTITSTDVTQKRVPKSFNELNKSELVAAAQAFGCDEEGSKESIKADLLESGVTFADYLAMFHPDVEAPVEPEPVAVEDEEGGEDVSEEIVTAAPELVLTQQKYLIKMTRENPYFEFGRYKFTKEKPYAIMTAEDAQRILESEDGFRQAFPSELQEFYG